MKVLSASMGDTPAGEINEKWVNGLAAEKLMIDVALDENERAYVMDKFARIADEDKGQRGSLVDMIATAVAKGMPTRDYLYAQVDDMPIPLEDKIKLKTMLDEQMQMTELYTPQFIDNMENELNLAKDVRDAEKPAN
jgi:hypothetical protein